VSALPADGSFAACTARFEKRNIAESVRGLGHRGVRWQCGKCVDGLAPDAVIRAKVVMPPPCADARGLLFSQRRGPSTTTAVGRSFTCSGREDSAPAAASAWRCLSGRNRAELRRKAINMEPQRPCVSRPAAIWDFLLSCRTPTRRLTLAHVKSAATAGAAVLILTGALPRHLRRNPLIKLASQFVRRSHGGATPRAAPRSNGAACPPRLELQTRKKPRPRGSNSLFEDTREFGLVFRVRLRPKPRRVYLPPSCLRVTPASARLRQGYAGG